MESVAITVQNTERDMYQYGTSRMSQSMRSDRNEDTLRPLADIPKEDGLALEQFGKQKTAMQNEEVFDNQCASLLHCCYNCCFAI